MDEDAIRSWQESTQDLRPAVINSATGAYFEALGRSENPTEHDISVANNAVQNELVRQLLTNNWVAAIRGNPTQSQGESASVELSFRSICPRLSVPAPQIWEDLSPNRVAIAAFVGAIVGIMIFTPLARFLLGMRDVGLFLGAPAGACSLVMAAFYSARNKKVKIIVMAVTAAVGTGSIIQLVRGNGLFRTIRSKTEGASVLKVALLSIAVIFVLTLAKNMPRYVRREHEVIVRSAVDQWLDSAILVLGLLVQRISITEDVENNQSILIQKILELRDVPHDSYPIAFDELISHLKNMGFETESAHNKTFCWETNHENRYDSFGIIETGDMAVVERAPVILRDKVLQKGLVRKQRKGV